MLFGNLAAVLVGPQQVGLDVEVDTGVEPRPLGSQPQVAVGDLGDAAPVSVGGAKDAPQPVERPLVAFAGDAAGIAVGDDALSVANQLQQPIVDYLPSGWDIGPNVAGVIGSAGGPSRPA